VSTDDAEDKALLVPLAIAPEIIGTSRPISPAFCKRVTKPADTFSERGSAENDADGIRSLVLLALHSSIDQLPNKNGVARHGRAHHSPRGGQEGASSRALGTLLWIVTPRRWACGAGGWQHRLPRSERRAEIGVNKRWATNS